MAVFMIIAEDDSKPREIAGIVDREFQDNYQVNRRCWLVAGKSLTTQKIAKRLGIEEEDDESKDAVVGVAIFRITPSYWGNAKNDLWDWLTANFE